MSGKSSDSIRATGAAQPAVPTLAPATTAPAVPGGQTSLEAGRSPSRMAQLDALVRRVTVGPMRPRLRNPPGAMTSELAVESLLAGRMLPLLKRGVFRVHGSNEPSGPGFAYLNVHDELSARPGTLLGHRRMHAAPRFNVWLGTDILPVPDLKNFPVISLRASTEPEFLRLEPPAEGGPRIFATGQLSGCCLVARKLDEVWEIAHVRPSPGESGVVLRRRMSEAFPGALLYGAGESRGSYDSSRRVVAVMGEHGESGWTLYAQKQDALSGGYEIVSVHTILP